MMNIDLNRILAKNNNLAFFSYNSDLTIVEVDKNVKIIFSLSDTKYINNPLNLLLQDLNIKNHTANQLKEGNHLTEKSSLVYTETNQIISFKLMLLPVFNDMNIFDGGIGILSLIRNSPVNELPALDMLRLVMDTIPQRVFWKNKSLQYTGCNKAFLQDAGLSDENEILGKDDYSCIWKEHADDYRNDDLQVINSGKQKLQYEEIQKRPDGTVAWLRTTKMPLKDKKGNIIGIFGSYEDITEFKKAEKALQESEARYRELIDFLPQTIFECDINSIFTYVSPSGLRFFGYSQEDIEKGTSIFDLIQKESHEKAKRNIHKIICEGKDSGSEYFVKKKNGEYVSCLISSTPIIKDYKIKGLRGIVFDITSLKNTQIQLEKEKNKLNAFIDALPDLAFIIDKEGTYREILCGDDHLLVADAKELKGKKVSDFFPAETANKVMEAIHKTITSKNPQVMNYEMITVEGKNSWFQGRTSYYYDNENKMDTVIWVARDITQLKRFQEEIEESKENLSITLESIGDAVVVTDNNGKIIRINRIAEEITQWKREEVYGLPIDQVIVLKDSITEEPISNPVYAVLEENKIFGFSNSVCLVSRNNKIYHITDSAAPICKNNKLIGAIMVFHDVTDKYKKEKNLIKSENRLKRAQVVANIGDWEHIIGSDRICASEQAFRIFGVERTSPCISISRNYSFIHPDDREMVKQAVRQLIDQKEKYDVIYRIKRENDQMWRIVQSIAEVIEEESGQAKLLGTIQDITEIKTAEDELKIRNAELNNFVYRVSHDLRAPLTSIKGLIHLQKIEYNDPPSQYLELIERSVEKLDRFIRDILSHSRNLNTSPIYEVIDFKKIVDQCFEELAYLPLANEIVKKVNIQGRPYVGDKIRINEILRNLISNSIKYANKKSDHKFINIKINITEEEAFIEIEDNGIGIKKEMQPKIFDMFYRGHENSEGSGIGLYIVKQALQKLNGDISVESMELKGTKFILNLPNTTI